MRGLVQVRRPALQVLDRAGQNAGKTGSLANTDRFESICVASAPKPYNTNTVKSALI